MNRRQLLRSLMMASGSLVALPAWAREWELHDVSQQLSSFSAYEQDMLAAIADTIIPEGGGMGALSTGVDKFLVKLFDDCYEEPVRENIKTKIKELDQNTGKAYSKPFSSCSQEEREKMLTAQASSGDKTSKEFFELVKAETIRGFNTSKPVMVNYFKYKVVPGHYYGCVDVNA